MPASAAAFEKSVMSAMPLASAAGGEAVQVTGAPASPASPASPGATTTTTAVAPVAEAGPKAATNPTLTTSFQSTSRSANLFVDTNVTTNVEYTYQLEVLDSHGNVAVRSEPQMVIDRPPATEATADHLDLDCRTRPANSDPRADRHAAVTVCSWNRVDRTDFSSYRLTRQVQGSSQAPAVLFLTTNANQTTFTDPTAVRGTQYVDRVDELNRSGSVIGRSGAVAAHPDTSAAQPDANTRDNQWMDGRSAGAR